MAFINAKRKRAEDTDGDKILNKLHKRHHSDHPLISVDNEAGVQPRNRNIRKVDGIAKDSPLLEEASDEGDTSESRPEDGEDNEDDDDDEDKDTSSIPPTDQFSPGSDDIEENSDPESPPSSESSMESASDSEPNSDNEAHPDTKSKKKEVIKADDPTAFASSMAGILGYKLTKTQRAHPILARSGDAKAADEALLDLKLEKKAKAEMKRQKVEKDLDSLREINGTGVSDTVGIDDGEGMGRSFSAFQQREKDLRKTAQKGVIKMFNAFTQVREKAVEAQRVGGSRARKEEKAMEMSKEGWLEYVGHGGKGKGDGKGKEHGGRENSLFNIGKNGKAEKTGNGGKEDKLGRKGEGMEA